MRILFISSALSPRGGAHRWLLSVLTRLQGRVQTHLAVGNRHAQLSEAEISRIGPWSRVKGLDRRGNRQRGRQGTLQRLDAEIKLRAPQVIQLNDITDPDLITLAARARPCLMMVQDHRFFCPGRGKVDPSARTCTDTPGDVCQRCFEQADHGEQMLQLTRRRLDALKHLTHLTVLSRYMARELTAVGLDPGRITVVPPFADQDQYLDQAQGAPREYHLMAGRLSSHKGVGVALEAALAPGLKSPLLVAGAGPLEREVQSAAKAHPKRIRFHGWAEHRHLADLMSRARTLWLPSLWAEPFGIVGLEALSRQVPVIASDVGGVSEWLDHEVSGLLVPPGSSSMLARAAIRMEQDPAGSSRMGQAGRRRVHRDFAPQAIMDMLVKTYRDVVEECVA